MNRAQFLRLMLGGAALAALPSFARAQAGRYDFWFTRLKYDSGDWDVDARMPSNLITSLIDYTTLRVDPTEHVVALSDPRMLEAPFCYLAGPNSLAICASNDLANSPSISWLQSSTNTNPPLRT